MNDEVAASMLGNAGILYDAMMLCCEIDECEMKGLETDVKSRN